MQAIDDLALLREYATNNSEAAFEALVSRYVRLVYSAALRQTLDPHLAEEVTQAVFVIFAKKADRISDGTILSGWFFKTTRFVALAQTRTAARRRHFEQEFHMRAEAQSKEPDQLWEQIAPLLDEALMQLGSKDRQAVLLRFFEEKSLAEVGSAFGTGEDAARMRINRALEKLHRYFNRRGISSTVTILAGALSTKSVGAAPVALAESVSAMAIAKGAAASGSTLALTQGGLKLMAWTKAKTAILAGIAILLTATTSIVTVEVIHAVRAAHYPNIAGAWEGVILLEEEGVSTGEAARTHVVLRFTQTNGVYTATTDWIEMGRRDVPMGRVVYNYPTLRLERSSRDTWKLTVNEDATQMILDHAIHFIQPDPVLLRRTTSPDPVPERLAENEFTPRAGSDLQGYWKGTIDAGPIPLPVDLKIAQETDGTFRAEGDDPMQGVNGRPVSVVYSRPNVRLVVGTGTGVFEGDINDVNTEIWGTWTQGGQSIPATLKRADYQADHAQDAAKDYSFNSKNDLQGHWKGSWVVTIANVKATIRFALDLAKLPDGSYSAALANIDEFGYDSPIPASEFHYDPPNLRMKWKWAETRYEGSLENGKLVGTWFQGGGGFSLVFERSASN
jgi:RNA polymerase sigma factor (sigma-70 family)